MGAVTPDGRVYTLSRQESLSGLHTITFLEHLLRHAGHRLLVIWDNSPIHRRKEVNDFIRNATREHLRVEYLPKYAPDLNPVEWLWQNLKQVQLANKPLLDLEDLHEAFHLAIARIRRRPSLMKSFFKAAGLRFT
jgi:transposase